jgi:hypothetical protein
MSDYTEVKASTVVRAVTNPSFANDNNSRDGKMRVFTYINHAHAVPLLRQVRQHAGQVLLNVSQAKDASSDLGKVSVQNAQDMVDLVNVLINCIQWNGDSGHVIGQNPIGRLQHEFTLKIRPKNNDSQYARPSIEFPSFVQMCNDEIKVKNEKRIADGRRLLAYHDVENPSLAIIDKYKAEVEFKPSVLESADSANGINLIISGLQITRPIQSDAKWNEMVSGNGFYGSNTDIMGHINSDHMALEEEVRFNNAGKQLMSAINKTGFASQYNVSNSQLQGNFIYHFVESMLPHTYPHKSTWQTMILSVLKSLPEIVNLKDRYAVLIEYIPYLTKSSDGESLDYVQIIDCIKTAYKDKLGINPTENWHNFRSLICGVDEMLHSHTRNSEIPNQIKRILDDISKMTINHTSVKNNKRTRDEMNKPKSENANINKTGVIISSGSGLNNSGNRQSKKKQQRIPHCWCCCADQSYTIANGHRAKECPKWDTVPVKDGEKIIDWVATLKSDSSKTMSLNDQKASVNKFINERKLGDKPIPRKNQ